MTVHKPGTSVLPRNQPCTHLDLGLGALGTVRESVCAVEASPSGVFGEDSPEQTNGVSFLSIALHK